MARKPAKTSARYAARTRREPTPRQQKAMRRLRFSLARAFRDYVKLLDLLGLLVITDDPKIKKITVIRGKK